MIITLMGMSGTGKSYWSQKMGTVGFKRYGCDDMISERLLKKLNIENKDTFEMHAWVGFPYEDTHAERAELYFETEIEVMQEIVDLLSKTDHKTNIVIDTSGSAIYTPPSLMEKLGHLSKMIYLAVTPEMINTMLNKYLQKPVAVLWNGMFEQREGETISESFARCYPKLLSSREELYQKYSHQIIGPEIHRSASLTVQSFIEAIQ
ncbi:MAG: hypothetical protein CL609_14955 [Anaerolineaceae bacterium]|nr:hypothetical protein [Anaerolineaceae bacterium]